MEVSNDNDLSVESDEPNIFQDIPTEPLSRMANMQDNRKQTPLHLSAMLGYEECCLPLVDITSRINILEPDSVGKTIWDYAKQNNMNELKNALLRRFSEGQTVTLTMDMMDDYFTLFTTLIGDENKQEKIKKIVEIGKRHNVDSHAWIY